MPELLLEFIVVRIQILPGVAQGIKARTTAGHAVEDALNKVHIFIAFKPALRPQLGIEIHETRRRIG